MLIRLVTGCSRVDAEQLMGGAVSDTTLRAPQDEWESIGMFIRKALGGESVPTVRFHPSRCQGTCSLSTV